MAATATSPVAHEIFCRPPLARGDGPQGTPRIEEYVAYRDADAGAVPAFHVTRCLECGATRYDHL